MSLEMQAHPFESLIAPNLSATNTTTDAVILRPSPLHIPEILDQILGYLSQLDLRQGASQVCKEWHTASMPWIAKTTCWTDVLSAGERRDTLDKMAQSANLIMLSKSNQIRYFMAAMRREVDEAWVALRQRLEELVIHENQSGGLPLLQQVEIVGPVGQKEHILPLLPYFRGITSLRLERIRTLNVDLDVYLNGCQHLTHLWIGGDESFIMKLTSDTATTQGELKSLLKLESLTLKYIAINHPTLMSMFQRSPGLCAVHCERLLCLFSPAETRQGMIVNRRQAIRTLAEHHPGLKSLHLSVMPPSSTLAETLSQDGWVQEFTSFPALESYSFLSEQAIQSTLPKLHLYNQNILTTLEILGPHFSRHQDNSYSRSRPPALRTWSFLSEALHRYLCQSPNLLHLKVEAIKYFADYFNCMKRADYDGQMKRKGCKTCLSVRDLTGAGGVDGYSGDNDDDDQKGTGNGDAISAIWACRNLQTLEIKLVEKDKEGEQYETMLKSRMMFGYLTLVCPRLQTVSIQRRIIHFGLEGGTNLISRWKYLRRLRLSAKDFCYGPASARNGVVEQDGVSSTSSSSSSPSSACLEGSDDWSWLLRVRNVAGNCQEQLGNLFLKLGIELAEKALDTDAQHEFPWTGPRIPITKDVTDYGNEPESSRLLDALSMSGSLQSVADVYLRRAQGYLQPSLLSSPSPSRESTSDHCLLSLTRVEIHQARRVGAIKAAYDLKAVFNKIRPEVQFLSTH
ncbi:hypothetical protein BG004_005383 [Podila humilis]|nr:hypothetical protein BG004_005383 [Podila humilis]